MLDEHLDLPFTEVLGVEIAMEKVHISDDNNRRHLQKAQVQSEDTDPRPAASEAAATGVEWIDAYRRWARGR